MKADTVLLWLLIVALLLAMLLTVLFAPRRSLHGYGEFTRPGGDMVACRTAAEDTAPT